MTQNIDLIDENKQLNREIVELMTDTNELKIKRQILGEDIQENICNYFNKCHSLKQTTEHFYFESVRYCYHALVEYFKGADYIIRTANDYEMYYYHIFGIRDVKSLANII
jgi:hypothetical protein